MSEYITKTPCQQGHGERKEAHMALIDHVGHDVYSDEAELRRYPTTLTVEDGIAVIEVNHDFGGEYIEDIESGEAGLYCTTCDEVVRTS